MKKEKDRLKIVRRWLASKVSRRVVGNMQWRRRAADKE